MSAADSTIEVFADDYGGVDGIGVILRGASIVEYEDDLVPGCKLTVAQAVALACALIRCAQDIHGSE